MTQNYISETMTSEDTQQLRVLTEKLSYHKKCVVGYKELVKISKNSSLFQQDSKDSFHDSLKYHVEKVKQATDNIVDFITTAESLKPTDESEQPNEVYQATQVLVDVITG